jgi:hypothetical protein
MEKRSDLLTIGLGFHIRMHSKEYNKSGIDWVFDTSDHAAVIIDVKMNDEGMRGPGMTRINIKMLEDPKIASKIGCEITQMVQQAGEHWNPHMRLEYLKVAIRTVFSNNVNEIRKVYKDK